MAEPLIKTLVIVGETASGKSDLAMTIAKLHKAEIVAADSRTLYKGMDIGTAKPTKADQEDVRHHLIDVSTPDKPLTVAGYKKLADRAIEDIHSRDKLAIIVGGSGLFVDSVIFDFSFLDKGDASKRRQLEKLTDEMLEKKAQKYDPHFRMQNNRLRAIRLIETKGELPQRKALPTSVKIIGIKPSRATLRANITKRTELMLRSGLKREAQELLTKYDINSKAFSGTIYKLYAQYQDGEISMEKLKRQNVQNELALAKKQRTWFKRNTAIQWFVTKEDAIKYVQQLKFT